MGDTFHTYCGNGAARAEALMEAAARAAHHAPLARVHPEDYIIIIRELGLRAIYDAKDGEVRILFPVFDPTGIRLHATADAHQALGGATLVTDDASREFLGRVVF